MLVPGVLLDGVERPDVGAGDADQPLGAADGPEETAGPVLSHLTGPSDLVAADRLVGTENQLVLVQLRLEKLLGHLESVQEVRAAALGAGEQGAAHNPAGGADDVRGLAAVERRRGGRGVTDHTHQERGGAELGLVHGAVHFPLLLYTFCALLCTPVHFLLLLYTFCTLLSTPVHFLLLLLVPAGAGPAAEVRRSAPAPLGLLATGAAVAEAAMVVVTVHRVLKMEGVVHIISYIKPTLLDVLGYLA